MISKIVAQKKEEVEQRKKALPLASLQDRIVQQKPPLDFTAAITSDHIRLIAEIKQASPSRGILHPDLNPVDLARTYVEGEAAAISVLTEANYFMGSIDRLSAIRQEVELPLLRKDFIFDPYQIYESRAYGADALLLIVAILEQAHLKELLLLSRSLGLSCLVEVHSEDEVERALNSGADVIGINNRDLNTFVVDIDTTRRLRSFIPPGRVVVAESGIRSRSDVERLAEWGINAILVGEALVTTDDVLAKMKEMIL